MNKKAIWVSYVILILLIIIAFIFIIFYPKISTELKKYNYNKASKSIVAIISGYDVSKDILTSDVMIGTAFCYKDGYLVTNYHNVTDGDISIITSDNNVFKAEVIAKDETRDIAILTSEANLPALKIADSDKCEKGDNVYSISTPVSAYLRYTYTSGMLTNTNIQGFGTQTLIQTNIDLSPGCSGAPLLNENFEVVGMITLKSTEFGAEGLGFAIPSSNLASYINVLENGDSILDLKLTFAKDLHSKYGIPNSNGITIQLVDESSPVKDLLKSGDIITEVNGNKIKNEVDFYDLIFENQDTQINLKVIRDGQETIIKIK